MPKKSISALLNEILDINSGIEFEDAKTLLKAKYQKELTRSNFDKIKSVRRKKNKGKKKNNTQKNIEKPNSMTPGDAGSTHGSLHSTRENPYPDYRHINVKGLLKDWAIHQLFNDSRAASRAADILINPEFIEQGDVIHGVYWTSETPPYERPDFLYDHQQMAMSLMETAHLLWQASRQLAGKTTATLLKDCEDMIFNPNYTVALVAPTVPLAVEVLFKFLYNPIKHEGKTYRFYDLLKPYLLGKPNQLGFRLKNGSRLMILSLNQSGSQGRTIDVIHIEELDKLGTEQSKRQALAGIINSIRANKEAKIRICCNVASGIFRLLKAELFKYGHYFNIFVEDPFIPEQEYKGYHTIINENTLVETIPTLDEILRIFSEILVSFAFAEGQLYNIDTPTDECFNPDKVEIAYNQKLIEPVYIDSAMGIDPGGKVDAFGCTIWSLTKEGYIDSRYVKRFYNATHTAKEQAKEIAAQYIRYNVRICQVESSAGSPWSMSLIADEVHKQSDGKIKFKYEYVNFEGEGQAFDKNNFVYLFKILLDYEKIVLHERNDEERALHHQITKYIPNKSESNNNPDDLVESGFHGVWRLLGGMQYVKKLIDLQPAPIGATTQE